MGWYADAHETSSRPYLIRALYDWIVDNGLTPYLLVNAERSNVQVPEEHVHEGRIVLNINPMAVRNMQLGNELIEFPPSVLSFPLWKLPFAGGFWLWVLPFWFINWGMKQFRRRCSPGLGDC